MSEANGRKWKIIAMISAGAGVVAIMIGLPQVAASWPEIVPAFRGYVQDYVSEQQREFYHEKVKPLELSFNEQRVLAIETAIIGLETRRTIYESQIDTWQIMRRSAEEDGDHSRVIELNRRIENQKREVDSLDRQIQGYQAR